MPDKPGRTRRWVGGPRFGLDHVSTYRQYEDDGNAISFALSYFSGQVPYAPLTSGLTSSTRPHPTCLTAPPVPTESPHLER